MSAEAVLEAEGRRCTAMLNADIQALEHLLDARLHFSHANGAVDDKVQYLAKMAGGRIVYRAIDWSEQSVLSLGSTVVLAGRMSTQVVVNGVAKHLNNRVLSVWVLDGAWRLLAFQSTPLAA
jgi:Domain of unknown function (DUF4440)